MAEIEEKSSRELTYRQEEANLPAEEELSQPSGTLKRVAEVISVILHPLFIPSLLFGLVFYFSPITSAPLASDYRLPMLGLLVLTTFIIPLCSILFLHYFGNMASLRMVRRQERVAPFLYISIFYAFTTYFFITKYQRFVNINVILAGITLLLFLITIITLYWKISAHSAGIWGAVGFLASFMLLYQDQNLLYPLSVMIVLAGASMSSRLYLNEHKPIEVWVGALLGFTVCFASVFFYVLI